MKLMKILVTAACLLSLLAGSALCADKGEKKLTCCQQAAAGGKDCKHKCCLAAHKEGKSCEKCNPNKEDLQLRNSDKKRGQKADPKADRTPAKQDQHSLTGTWPHPPLVHGALRPSISSKPSQSCLNTDHRSSVRPPPTVAPRRLTEQWCATPPSSWMTARIPRFAWGMA